jgi:predicted metalloprotease with PDZ domain
MQKHMRPFIVMTALVFGLSSAVGLAQCNFGPPSSQHELNYSFDPIISQDKLSLRVTLSFQSARSGKTTLILPSEWAGQKEAYKSVSELVALSPGTSLKQTKEVARREVRSSPNALVRISYLLSKQWSGPLNSATRFYADLSLEYFHLIGITSLVHPKLKDFWPVEVHFDWSKLPQQWSLATSFGTDERCQTFKGNWTDALNSLFVGGDYRIYRGALNGNAIIFAIRGKWSFSDNEWTGRIAGIVEFQRTFWHDNNFPYFLITLTPFGFDHGSSGGTALTNAFMEHLSRLDSISQVILNQISHEEFHSWNPYRMGQMSDPEEAVNWFTEGFTRYYEALMLTRTGQLSFPDYVDVFNLNLRNYALNDAKNIPLTEFVRRRRADKTLFSGLEYQRGAVIAAWLDLTIRAQSHGRFSLDDLMFYLVRQNAEHKRTHGKPLFISNKRFFKAAASYVDRKSLAHLVRYAEYGGDMEMPRDALGPCVESRLEPIGRFELGFDRSSVDAEPHKVAGLKEGSEAYKAGLRKGQQLNGWSIQFGDPTKLVTLRIQTGSGRQVITYYPQGKKVPVQQFVLDQRAYNTQPEVCSAGFWR